MKPAPFVYHRPAALGEALRLLAEGAEDGALILAGGQSLVPMMALRVALPPTLIDINRIAELSRIEVSGQVARIGATIRHAAFHDSRAVPAPLGEILRTVAQHIAHYPIRQRGTFCGSLAHSDPASEWCLVSAVLGVEIELRSLRGCRLVRSEEYFESPMMTMREPDEIIVAAHLPLPLPDTRWGFYEFNRRAGDFALGMALVLFRVEEGRIVDPRLGIGGIEGCPRRLPAAEEVLVGEKPGPEVFALAAEAAMGEVDPMEDATTSKTYRRDLCGTVLRRALSAAIARPTQPA